MESQRFVTTAHTPQLKIDLPESLLHQKIEVIISPLNSISPSSGSRKRRPPAALAGKVKEYGDVMTSAPLSDWGVDG